MSTFNKTILIGRIVEKPEMTTVKGTAMATFAVTNSRIRCGKEEQEYSKIWAFGPCAESCAAQLNPKDLVCIEGRLQCKKSDQVDAIILEHITFLSKSKK